MANCGSAPRVRGRRERWRLRPVWMRLSPARAGTTSAARSMRAASAAQPRACGDDRVVASLRGWRTGSAPRVRGRQVRYVVLHERHRLSPARAGTTPGGSVRGCSGSAQPRACGDDSRRPLCHDGDERLSPARAGTTAWPVASPPRRSAQPRACGDDERDRRGGDAAHRLSPARAGTTRRRSPSRSPATAQPRACGDDTCRKYLFSI